MGPIPKKKKMQNKIKTFGGKASRERERIAGSFIFFFKFLVFKSSFSDSRVSVRQNSSG